MAGGAPAGINILPGEEGCRTKRTRIRTTTMHGKMMTTPKGTEMLELPFNLRGLRKKASREANRLERGFLPPFSSDRGSCGGPEGMSLPARRKRSIGREDSDN